MPQLRNAIRTMMKSMRVHNLKRSIKTLDFAGSKETVYERTDYPPEKLQRMFANETFAVVGYGTQVSYC